MVALSVNISAVAKSECSSHNWMRLSGRGGSRSGNAGDGKRKKWSRSTLPLKRSAERLRPSQRQRWLLQAFIVIEVNGDADVSKKKKTELPPHEEVVAIIERTMTGDEKAMPALRDLLDRMPSIRKALGADLDHAVELTISKSLGGSENLAFREGLKRKLAELREELEGPNPSPIERLLVDRVVACWLQVQDADLGYAEMKKCSFAQAEFHLKRQDRAHRRFLSAMKTLATVRKMALPAIQVNIGENQVNVANAACSDVASQ